MAERQELRFSILAEDHASKGFLAAGRAAAAASDDVLGLAKRLDQVQNKRAQARVDLAGNKEALAQLDELDRKLIVTGRKVTPDITIEGAAKASLEISALDAKLDGLSAKSVKATSAVGLPGLSGVSGMGALIGAGVVLSPIIATIGFGVAGFGAAAAGAVAPVFKAAQAAGGLKANMSKLDPEQRKVAQGLLGLGKQYHAFEQALQPTVLKDFSGGLKIAGHLMHDLQPVSAATGKVLGTLLGRIDAEFQSGTWQDFFGFMGRTAGPDVKLVGDAFVTLTDTVPGLLQALQPVARDLLIVSVDALKVVDAVSKIPGELDKADTSAKKSGGFMGGVRHGLIGIGKVLVDPGFGVSKIAPLFAGPNGISHATDKAAGSWQHATPVAWNLAAAIGGVTHVLDAQLAPLLTSQGDWVTWKQAQQKAVLAINAVHGSLNGQSAAALNADQSIITATQGALAFADAQKHTKAGVDAADTVLRNQIRFLETHAGKSRIARKEIDLLRAAEAKLHDIRQHIAVTGTGSWHVAHGLGARGTGVAAAGWRVPGFGGGDKWPAMLEGGEAVVPKHLVPPLAPFLKANQVPGFSAGGYAGTVPGLGKWLVSEDKATLLSLEKAAAAGVTGALAGMGGSGALGGDAAANKALAARIFPFGASQWAPFVALEMQEAGFNRFARNRFSGAYGIPQALPPTKMPFAAQAAGGSHAGPQLGWMFNYIAERYGSPAAAWGHEVSAGWYDGPGPQFLPRGLSLAMNTSGAPERVLSASEARGLERRLDMLISLMQRQNSITAGVPDGIAAGLNGVARMSASRAMYSAR